MKPMVDRIETLARKAQDSRVPLIVARQSMDSKAIKTLVDAVVGAAPSQLHVTLLVETLLRPPS
jgi:hypothetical protein